MNRREQIHRERLLSQILVEQIDNGEVSVFSPASVSELLYQHFRKKGITSSQPKRGIFGTYPDDELVVALLKDKAEAEVKEFVYSLPFNEVQ